jgi:hypothetical protein
MPLPYTFISGELARSAHVNANFNYVMDIIGQLSSPGSIAALGEFKLGSRMLALFSAAQDTGPNELAFFQLAWNVNYNKVGSTWRYDRKIPNQPATSVKIGRDGLAVLTTSSITGDLNNQLTKVLGVTATTTSDRMYLKKDLHIQNYDGLARNIQDYRLTTTFLETPIPIYANKWLAKGTTVFNAHNMGVPAEAQAILVYMHITSTGNSGAGMHAYQRRAGGGDALNYFRGFVTHAAKADGIGHRAGSQGMVPLGRGAVKGDFVIYRTATMELANVYIMGYMS